MALGKSLVATLLVGGFLSGCAESRPAADYVPYGTEAFAVDQTAASLIPVLTALPTGRPHKVIGQVIYLDKAGRSFDQILGILREKAVASGGQALFDVRFDTVQSSIPTFQFVKESDGHEKMVVVPQAIDAKKGSALVLRYL